MRATYAQMHSTRTNLTPTHHFLRKLSYMKSALFFLASFFAITTSVVSAKRGHAFRNVRNTAGFSWPSGEYFLGDAIYGFCTLKSWEPSKVGPQFVKDAG